ncbi:signal peptidase I [Motilibacter peucedani]|uniref:Signal peptidase I n=1 Tax=Motilibacter peucedani TaxID=598650 RepID=A0A420XRB9_9ACTN|nr:signal peptidase I [Motilibacter peucedani]RKS77351.1 signal peptidase I [Motilibacter peucedani]
MSTTDPSESAAAEPERVPEDRPAAPVLTSTPGEPAGDAAVGADGPDPSAPAEDADQPHRSHRRRGFLPVVPSWAELPVLVGLALVLAMVVKAFLVQAFYIPSGSMEDTLRVGDRVLVDKVSYRFGDIHRGDIVVFNGVDSFTSEVDVEESGNPVARAVREVGSWVGVAQPSERDFIKRVIGVPGDHVVADGHGKVVVNGVPLEETSYLFPGDAPSDRAFDVTVPAGKLWVMGDHRSESADSREHMGDPGGGYVPEDKVIGKAFVVVWPFGHWDTLGTPKTFHDPASSR